MCIYISIYIYLYIYTYIYMYCTWAKCSICAMLTYKAGPFVGAHFFCRSGKTPIRSRRSSRLPDFLAQNIEQHFKVPVQFQVLCHLAAVVPGWADWMNWWSRDLIVPGPVVAFCFPCVAIVSSFLWLWFRSYIYIHIYTHIYIYYR